MSIITVVGAGMMGSAIAIPASDNGHEVRLVGTQLDREIVDQATCHGTHMTLRKPLPSSFRYFQFEGLDTALDGAELVVCGVSSFGVDWFATQCIPHISENIPILSVTKGMHLLPDDTLITFPAYLTSLYPTRQSQFYAVGGPCTSYELADHEQTEVCFCGPDARVLAWIRSLFETSYYHISTSTDVTGVEVAVAMKNAYALGVCLAVGIAAAKPDGCEEYNPQAALFGQSVREIAKLLEIYGGGADNLVYGAGDLYVTIFGGRTRAIGTLLGEGVPLKEALERLNGVTLESVVIAARTGAAVKRLIREGKAQEKDFPLLLHVASTLEGGNAADIPWDAFEVHAE